MILLVILYFNQYLKAFETFKLLGYGPAKGRGLDFENQYSLYFIDMVF